MNRIPIRARITMVVVAVAGAAFLLLGSFLANTIETTATDNTLGSTGEALEDVGDLLERRSDDILVALKGAAEDRDSGNTDLRISLGLDQAGGGDDRVDSLRWDVLDRSGEPIVLTEIVQVRPDGPVVRVAHELCRSFAAIDVGCEGDAFGSDSAAEDLMRSEVERRAIDESSLVIGNVVMWGDKPVIIIGEARLGLSAVSSGVEGVVITLMVVLLVALGVVTWLAVGRALRPVESLTAELGGIDNDSLDQRVEVPPAKDQLRLLAKTMNGMLARLEAARDQQRRFVSDASHELRSPITANLATLEVAKANSDNADWEQVASVLEEENTRLAELVDDLLLLARLDERNAPAVSVVDLDELCLAEAARTHPVPVKIRVNRPARVLGSAPMLARAIRNLVDNAVVHASTTVQIEIDAVASNGRMEAVVRVSDDGPGVPPEHRSSIFERFNRADESRNRDNGGGAGLGLAIVYEIATAFGGSVSLAPAAKGEGACFVLALPHIDS